MKSTLRFDMEEPYDVISFHHSINAHKYYSCLEDIRIFIKKEIKYSENEERIKLYEELQNKLFEILSDNDVHL